MATDHPQDEPPPKEPRVQVARHFGGSDFGRFECLRSISAGGQQLGKVDIDCKLRLSQSRCGVLGREHQPAAVLYMDLAFNQPPDCRLARATVLVTVAEQFAPPPQQAVPYGAALSMTDAYGPLPLCGPLKKQARRAESHLTPFVDYGGFGFGGLGRTKSRVSLKERRWSFAGDLVRPRDRASCSMRSGAYRTLRWDLEENAFDCQALHCKVFHTAFVFEHDVVPFVLNVEIDGKLQRARDRVRMSFPQGHSKGDGVTRTLVNLTDHYRGDTPNRNRLDLVAERMPADITELNRQSLPYEVGDERPGARQSSLDGAFDDVLKVKEEEDDEKEDDLQTDSIEHLRKVGNELLLSKPHKREGRDAQTKDSDVQPSDAGENNRQPPLAVAQYVDILEAIHDTQAADNGTRPLAEVFVGQLNLMVLNRDTSLLNKLISYLLYILGLFATSCLQAIGLRVVRSQPSPPSEPPSPHPQPEALPEVTEPQTPTLLSPYPPRPTVETAANTPQPSLEPPGQDTFFQQDQQQRERRPSAISTATPSISSHASSRTLIPTSSESADLSSAVSASDVSSTSDVSDQTAKLRRFIASSTSGWAKGGRKARFRGRRVRA